MVKNYIVNFHETREHQSFATYWRRFGYAEMVDRMEELFSYVNTTELRIEFLEEVSQTPARKQLKKGLS